MLAPSALDERTRVDACVGLEPWDGLAQGPSEALKALADVVVVVASPGVAGDPAGESSRIGWCRVGIAHAQDDD